MCEKRPVIVSACLMGFSCRYDKGSKPLSPDAMNRLKELYLPIPLCPEQLGGLPTPRPPMEIVEGDGEDVLNGQSRVMNERGEDLSEAMVFGARQVAGYAQEQGITTAIMKDGSPSCGVLTIRRRGKKVEGMGVTTALLRNHGLRVISESEL